MTYWYVSLKLQLFGFAFITFQTFKFIVCLFILQTLRDCAYYITVATFLSQDFATYSSVIQFKML